MNQDIIWELKSDKLTEEIKNGKRLDGRKFDEYRPISVDVNVSQNADGSARVKLGETTVVTGIKMVPGEPYPDSPGEGTINVGVELLPLASPEFETGPPRENAIELARVVDRGIRESKCLDFKKLCIREGELVWVVFIDMYALNDAGNLFDAFSISALASLLNTRVPKLDGDTIVKGEYSGKLKLESKPLLCTFGKIANSIVADPTIAEEKAMQARFSVASTEEKLFTAFQKGGGGSFNAGEIENCMATALKRAAEIRKLV